MKIAILYTTLLFTASACAAAPAAHVAPAAKAQKTAPAAAPKEQLQEVTYEDLGKYLNQHIVVRTTLHTERRGTLVKYSGTAIDLKLDTGATLGLPRETIKSLGVPVAPPDPLFPASDKK
jgi:hypothetical protein